MKKIDFKPDICKCCGQATEYLLKIDRGTVDIVKIIALAIGGKGVNCVHLYKELEATGRMTSHQAGNITRARIHGLVAKVRVGGEFSRGNYLLTKKGAAFLNGERIPEIAIVKKATDGDRSHQEGYFEPEERMCTVHDFQGDGPYWEGIGYTIKDGDVIENWKE